jgi:hypothetical protein
MVGMADIVVGINVNPDHFVRLVRHHKSSRRPLKNGLRTLPSANFARYSISEISNYTNISASSCLETKSLFDLVAKVSAIGAIAVESVRKTNQASACRNWIKPQLCDHQARDELAFAKS